jgi:glycosyltransferase involved in cell wall biosynthesis
VWLLTNSPSPYQVELFAAIDRLSDVELHVRFMRPSSSADPAHCCQCGFSARILSGMERRWWRDEFRLHLGALWEAAWSDADCFILSGLYTSPTFLGTAFILTLRRKPWAVWLERPHSGWEHCGSSKWIISPPTRWIRTFLQKSLFRWATRIMCIGTAARDAYQNVGAPAEKLLLLPYCCDLRRYDEVDPESVQRVKDRYRLQDKTVFLFSGQMIVRKGVDLLLSAFQMLAAERDDVALLLLGDGPLREKLQSQVRPSLADRVHFAGFVNQPELPAHFQAADVFVFPSRHDGWGVVVNEACAAALPVITTRQTGAAHDLVRDGQSGFVVERDDVDSLCRCMQYLADHPETAREFGRRSRELVEPFSAENGARRFCDHVYRTMHDHAAE